MLHLKPLVNTTINFLYGSISLEDLYASVSKTKLLYDSSEVEGKPAIVLVNLVSHTAESILEKVGWAFAYLMYYSHPADQGAWDVSVDAFVLGMLSNCSTQINGLARVVVGDPSVSAEAIASLRLIVAFNSGSVAKFYSELDLLREDFDIEDILSLLERKYFFSLGVSVGTELCDTEGKSLLDWVYKYYI